MSSFDKIVVIDLAPKCIKAEIYEPNKEKKPAIITENDARINEAFKDGIITNWAEAENVFRYIFDDKLKVDVKRVPVLICEPLKTPDESREKLTKMMFETFNCKCLYLANRSVLSTYATGRKEGVLIESTESQTLIAPINDGFVMKNEVVYVDIGCGKLVESLKDPEGIHKKVNEVITKNAKSDILYQNIILAEAANVKGFKEGLERAITRLRGSSVKVIEYSHGDHQAWTGGYILAAQPAFWDMFITQSDYDKSGSGIIHTKCK